jgi:hypothetical protein
LRRFGTSSRIESDESPYIRRRDGEVSTMHVATTGGRVAVETLGMELAVEEIFRHSSVP